MWSAVSRRMRVNGTVVPQLRGGRRAGRGRARRGPRPAVDVAAAGPRAAAAGAAAAGRLGLRRLDELEHVAARDPAVAARAADGREIELVLGGEPANGRRQALMARRAGSAVRLRARAARGGDAARSRRRVLLRGFAHRRRHRGVPRRRRRLGRRAPARGAGAVAAARRGGCAAARPSRLDDREHRADVDRGSGRHEDLRDHAAHGGRHLHRDLVGLDVEQDLVGGDRVADLLVPIRDGALGDGFAELRHQYIHRRLSLSG